MSKNITEQIISAKSAAIKLSAMDTQIKNKALEAMADALDNNRDRILKANAKDMVAAEELVKIGKLSHSVMNRLKVDDNKISGMIAGILSVRSLEDPVGETLSTVELDEDLALYQVSCPIGLLGVIFESRPDVVPQIMALCLKSGNAVAFKGGSEAAESNRALFFILTDAIASAGVPRNAFVLM